MAESKPDQRSRHTSPLTAEGAEPHGRTCASPSLAAELRRRQVVDAFEVCLMINAGNVQSDSIPTGFRALDAAIGGGLPQGGLTVLGAGSSIGKTTWALQVADNLASHGWPILFVSIEQSSCELIAKTLSRMMRRTARDDGGHHVASAAHILSARERASWTPDKEAALLACCTAYSCEIAPRMHIMECDSQPTLEAIEAAYAAVAECERADGVAREPVVVVDYLQLMEQPDPRMTERQAIDANVTGLRRLARDRRTAVLAISSINRQAYTEAAGMSAFKESGCIEFSADLALMLQPRDFESRTIAKGDKSSRDAARRAAAEHKSAPMRESEIVVLKNRNGPVPRDPMPFRFDAMCSLFTEDDGGRPALRVR